jgi:hypothetical protein
MQQFEQAVELRLVFVEIGQQFGIFDDRQFADVMDQPGQHRLVRVESGIAVADDVTQRGDHDPVFPVSGEISLLERRRELVLIDLFHRETGHHAAHVRVAEPRHREPDVVDLGLGAIERAVDQAQQTCRQHGVRADRAGDLGRGRFRIVEQLAGAERDIRQCR